MGRKILTDSSRKKKFKFFMVKILGWYDYKMTKTV
jgi:hypothetical protein